MIPKAAFSSYYHCFIHHDGGQLFSFLQKNLTDFAYPEFNLYTWQQRALHGGVYVNGIYFDSDIELPKPAKIEYYEPKYDILKADEFFPKFDPSWVVYEDQYLIVTFKPAGIPTMPAKEQAKFSLKNYVDEYLHCSVDSLTHFPSRIDTSTQGLVIASKHPDTHKLLQHLFEHKKIQKEYILFTEEKVAWENIVVDVPIGKSEKHPVLRWINGKEAKNAVTRFSLLNADTNGTFIKAAPITGRTHQIRVHAAANGFPIKGDKFYGTNVEKTIEQSEPLCLISYALEFIHPISNNAVKLAVPQNLLPGWISPSVSLS